MTLNIETIFLTVALAGTSAYMAFTIQKRREEIRKTLQVVELADAEFWEGLTQLRDLVPAKA